MGDDEVATVRTLTAYRAVMATHIQTHRGRVAGLLVLLMGVGGVAR